MPPPQIHVSIPPSRKALPRSRSLRTGALLLLVMIVALSEKGSAQRANERAASIFGVAAGYEFGIPLVLNRSDNAPFICDCEGTGVSYNHTISVGMEMLLPRLLTPDIGAAARITTGFAAGRFTSDPYAALDSAVDPDPTQNRFIVDAGSTHLEAQLLATFRLGEIWSIGLGPAVSYRVGGVFTQKEEIVGPAETTFPTTGSNERIVASGSTLAGPPLVPSVLLRASYRIPLSSGMELHSDLHGRLDLNAITRDGGLRSFSVGAGFSLFFGADQGTSRIDTVIVAGGPTDRFTTSLDIFGRDAEGKRVEKLHLLRKVIHQRQHASLLPVVYFERGSSMIPARYVRYTTEETEHFTLDSLAVDDARSHYYHLLNLIGMRLRADRAATVTLAGSSGIDEHERLATARAEEVRRYLTESWGIAQERIAIKRATGEGTDRRDRSVKIIPSSEKIIDPLRTEWVVRQLDAPAIEIDPRFEGGRGMKRWDISIRQGGLEVARYSSDGTQGDRGLDAELIAADSVLEPLVAEIIAEDSSGALAAARDRLPLEVNDAADGEFVASYIIDPSEAMAGRALFDEMILSVRQGRSITIIHPNDSAGLVRAKSLADALRPSLQGSDRTIELRAANADDVSRNGGDLPEDRLLDGHLTVIIQNPTAIDEKR